MFDIPLAAIYSGDNVDSRTKLPSTITFQGGLGVAEGHSLAV